jgi:hypothetical protein
MFGGKSAVNRSDGNKEKSGIEALYSVALPVQIEKQQT